MVEEPTTGSSQAASQEEEPVTGPGLESETGKGTAGTSDSPTIAAPPPALESETDELQPPPVPPVELVQPVHPPPMPPVPPPKGKPDDPSRDDVPPVNLAASREANASYAESEKRRFWFALIISLLTVMLVLVALLLGYWSTEELFVVLACPGVKEPSVPLVIAWLTARASISIGLLTLAGIFGRTAERMMLPQWFLGTGPTAPLIAATLLGHSVTPKEKSEAGVTDKAVDLLSSLVKLLKSVSGGESTGGEGKAGG